MSSGTPDPASAPANSSSESKVETSTEKNLPPLSPSEFRKYNRMAEHMEQFHSHFRYTWKILHATPNTLSPLNFIRTGLQFAQHLTVHHQIEEMHVFPNLATRMESFRPEVHLLQQHAKIHDGLDNFVEYLEECKRGERDLRHEEIKKIMDEFGEVLWAHLDDEVKELGAENMRKFWTLEEVGRMMM
ncbi:hypothetical protein RUND412_007338 [Rhizina undulata]